MAGVRTAQHVYDALFAGDAVSDLGVHSCFQKDTPCEFVPHYRDAQIEARDWTGNSRIPWNSVWTLTGWRVFAYAGRGSAFEATRDGVTAWLTQFRFVGDVPAPTCDWEPVPMNGPVLVTRDARAFNYRVEHAVRVQRTYFGVRLPRFCDFWDDRTIDGAPYSTDSERYQYFDAHYFQTSHWDMPHPVSCSGTADTRPARNAFESALIMRDLRKALAREWREWRRAHKRAARPGQGGGVEYAPRCVMLCNYGWVICGDQGTRVVGAFREWNVPRPTKRERVAARAHLRKIGIRP